MGQGPSTSKPAAKEAPITQERKRRNSQGARQPSSPSSPPPKRSQAAFPTSHTHVGQFPMAPPERRSSQEVKGARKMGETVGAVREFAKKENCHENAEEIVAFLLSIPSMYEMILLANQDNYPEHLKVSDINSDDDITIMEFAINLLIKLQQDSITTIRLKMAEIMQINELTNSAKQERSPQKNDIGTSSLKTLLNQLMKLFDIVEKINKTLAVYNPKYSTPSKVESRTVSEWMSECLLSFTKCLQNQIDFIHDEVGDDESDASAVKNKDNLITTATVLQSFIQVRIVKSQGETPAEFKMKKVLLLQIERKEKATEMDPDAYAKKYLSKAARPPMPSIPKPKQKLQGADSEMDELFTDSDTGGYSPPARPQKKGPIPSPSASPDSDEYSRRLLSSSSSAPATPASGSDVESTPEKKQNKSVKVHEAGLKTSAAQLPKLSLAISVAKANGEGPATVRKNPTAGGKLSAAGGKPGETPVASLLNASG